MIRLLISLFLFITYGYALNPYLLEKELFNKKNCSIVLENPILKSCYDYDYKGTRAVTYKVSGLTVNEENLKGRGIWHENALIPENKRSSNNDYKIKKYDRGHLTPNGKRVLYDRGHLAPDSVFDFNKKILNYAYDINANCVPMHYVLNENLWLKAENDMKDIALKIGYVKAIDIINYDSEDRMGDNKIAVPSSFIKIIFNEEKKFKKCYYYENNINKIDLKKDKLENHVIDCNKLIH